MGLNTGFEKESIDEFDPDRVYLGERFFCALFLIFLFLAFSIFIIAVIISIMVWNLPILIIGVVLAVGCFSISMFCGAMGSRNLHY
ncbi:MAG: hypothetical protein WCX30_01740 [Candidatus Paceibacterota bacterium]|jgi:hypothetical protein|nr:hypothetical protein [bacterium]